MNRVTGTSARPAPARVPGMRSCWRCGREFKGHDRLRGDAPCPDCREILAAEGDTTRWDRRASA